MSQEKHKDIELEGAKYKIGRLNAIDGGWVLRMVLKGMGAGQALEGVAPTPDQALLTEAEWRRMTMLLLGVCSKYNTQGLAVPVLMQDGRFAVPELEFDAVTVTGLIMATSAFNMHPFLAGGGLNRITETLQASSPSATPVSTPSSGDPS